MCSSANFLLLSKVITWQSGRLTGLNGDLIHKAFSVVT